MGKIDEEKISRFCCWLKDNGAAYPKILWPSNDTMSGIRGAIATSDIETNEVMFTIPKSLMMNPETAFSDPEMGRTFQDSQDILRGDLLLTMFVVYEITKGENSFFAPFLDMLPVPDPCTMWTAEECEMLQVC